METGELGLEMASIRCDYDYFSNFLLSESIEFAGDAGGSSGDGGSPSMPADGGVLQHA